ncbi:MAG: metallophosphoesterase family protein [Lentisphaerae bacterium]|nr:metallophosphoesterase family protein [Lentisphaerota bacterium]MBT5613142.1 metallophosphoesterase family protein [Lentisphaerota bacterium]
MNLTHHTCGLFLAVALPLLHAQESTTSWGPWRPTGESAAVNPVEQQSTRGTDRSSRDSGHGPTGGFRTEVPGHPYDIVLGRPTRTSVTISVLSYPDATVQVHYGTNPEVYPETTDLIRVSAGAVREIAVTGLQANTRYYYRLVHRRSDDGEREAALAEGTFHTQRPAATPFTFTIQADSHLDENTEPTLYAQALRNARADEPDFHIDLGDTFMTGKYGRRHEDALPQYMAQRYYFSLLCHSAPLFLVLGNHDGETDGRVTAAIRMRTKYFPNPTPNSFYTGSPEQIDGVGPAQNYYAWEWGDALFVVLDPFRYTAEERGRRKSDNWGRTLGKEQYGWLRNTLESSTVPFKFVFVHHLVGGLDRNARGGVEAATLYEWGGRDPNGDETFSQHRPGWQMPIHDLLVRNGVDIVFHGHDHFFARQELDGITYQLVPQPGHPGTRRPRYAEEYGYAQGDILGGAGHIRVRVGPEQVRVEFVQVSAATRPGPLSGSAAAVFSYTVPSAVPHRAAGRP